MFNNNMNIDPITSFSNDQYYTLNSYLIHPQYLSPSTHHHQSLSFHSVSFQSDPFDDIDEENQNHLLPQNHLHSHDNINNILQQQQQHHYSKPSFLRESAEKITSAVLVLPEGTSFCNPTITTSGIFMKGKSPAPNHDDQHQQQLFISSENLGGKKPVSPTDHHHVQPQSNIPTKRGSSGGCGSSSNGKNKKRKDRHSKILITPTTRPRHRRMRLSIDVAREFFDLQDMLGVERASKTVEWLLIKAKPDIDKLRELNNRGSCSTSTSSGLDEEGMNGSGDQSGEAAGSGTSTKPARIKEKKKKYTRSKTSKRIVINPLAKERRVRARERARKRTREKIINNKGVEMNINNNINPSSSSLDQAVLHLVSSCDHDHNHYQHHQHYDDQFAQEPSLIVANTKGWNNLQTSTTTSAAFVDDESCNSNLVNNIHDMGRNLWNPSLVATNSLSNVVSAAATTTTATATAAAAFGVPQQDQFSFFGNGWEGCNSQSLGFPET